MQKIIKARKKSNLAPSPLQRKRIKQLSGVRNFIAGIGSEAHHTQQSSELKLLGYKAKVNVCRKAGIQPRNFMTKRVALAIKTSLGLSWTHHRLQKRILSKEVGLTFEGEAKERREKNKMLTGNVKEDNISAVETKAKTKKNQFTHLKSPVVFVENLTKSACELLNEYQEGNKLIWHEGMPKDEIWIKIGGDHGGKSAIFNVKENTVVFSCPTTKDYHHILEQLTKLHTEQLNTLQNTQWNGKTIKVFLLTMPFCAPCLVCLGKMVPTLVSGVSSRKVTCKWFLKTWASVQEGICQKLREIMKCLKLQDHS